MLDIETVLKGKPWPVWPRTDINAVLHSFEEILHSTTWTIRSPGADLSRTEIAEKAFASFAGSPYALMVSSGTTAVELAVRALKPPPGAKVIVPALGWFATAAAVKRAGATPVFADVDPLTSCIDPVAVESLIGPDVIAVVAVHLHCALANLSALVPLCERHGLTLIEDCAQAHGAAFDGRPVGTFGAMACFSLNQEKMIAVGEGGCVITADETYYRRLHALRTDGYLREGGTGRSYAPQQDVMGGNACMSEFAAALVPVQLERFEEESRRRRKNALRLSEELSKLDGVDPLQTSEGTTTRAFHEFAFSLSPSVFGPSPAARMGPLLEKILKFPIHETDEPTQDCPMMALSTIERAAPNASKIFDQLLVFHHSILLDDRVVDCTLAALDRLPRENRVDSASSAAQG
ncbi:aminotransferase class I/II-fold pyridoxal phosphate-dependent enzyme [Parerythrobacter aestuarii]|uniref:aminotransferase class I/II-fold pyridoxal phosphate-dependent enzyme n=1 Tax=Parerythrobacter aestuarii TaxID=3020909 RepID=UPI0024DEFE3E|nr:aminotransferase class I/II-fold pyridoxal phosphate-dependent enzyme [Parerythrobacter aestuarii]